MSAAQDEPAGPHAAHFPGGEESRLFQQADMRRRTRTIALENRAKVAALGVLTAKLHQNDAPNGA